MPSRPRLLVLNERDPLHPKAGGAEVHVSEIFGRLAARGYEIVLASCAFRGAARRERLGDLEIWRLGSLPHYYPRAAWTCARETRRGRFDLVVEHLNKLPFCSPMYSAVPVVAVCHHFLAETAFLQAPWPIAAVVWSAEHLVPRLYPGVTFVAVSESTRDELRARGVAAERIRVIHNGVRHPELEVGPPSVRGCRVAYVGRIEPYKRVDVLLEAVASLVPQFPDLELLIIGRGAAQPDLEVLAAKLGIAARTRFTGFVTDPERDALVASARVCVSPSLKEGWGITVIEANALGTPVVAADSPGLRDSVQDSRTGFLAPPGDSHAFADRIAFLLRDDRLVDRLSQAAIEWSRRFTWDAAAAEMHEAFASALGPPEADSRAGVDDDYSM